MLAWLKDKESRSFRSSFGISRKWNKKRPISESNDSSTSATSTLVQIDKETQRLITKAFRKLNYARGLHEQVVLTNSIASYYSCTFQEREFIQLLPRPRNPIGPRQFKQLTSDDFNNSKVKKAVLGTATLLGNAKKSSLERFNSMRYKASSSVKEKPILKRRKSDVTIEKPNPTLKRRKSDNLLVSMR